MKKQGTIIIRIEKGLGNQLFQYACARAWKEKGLNVYLDMKPAYANKFRKTRGNDSRKTCIHNFNITLSEIDVEKYGKYEYIRQETRKQKLIYSLAKYGMWKYKFYEESKRHYFEDPNCFRGNYYVRAWFQDERNFRVIRKILLRELTPRKKIQISKELRQMLEYEESVSIHVRRGDYVRAGITLNTDYYNKAVEQIKKIYSKPRFLIFSEDLEWVKKNLKYDNCFYINEDKKLQDYEELLIMSRCKSNIISNSTFSWWGAWLNCNPQKVVIAPSNQWLSKQGDILPAEWIQI